MIEDVFENDVILYIKQQIKEAYGREVFFIAVVDEYGVIVNIKAIAKGNKNSVPVIFKEAYRGDCVIHNHPLGNLEPSEADISIASQLGNDGIGFIIVNNEMTEYYVVVNSVSGDAIKPLDSFSLLKIISKNGAISKHLTNYEQRESQELMLENVIHCFNNNSIGLIEAGTGTGKSIAYLIPSIIWAVKNKEKIVVSTNTINLQEQLLKKDIPLLEKVIPEKFTPVLVKGAGNYICLKKLNKLISGTSSLFVNEDELHSVEDIVEFANNKAKEGSKDELGFVPDPSLWEKICVETDICTRAKCFHFQKCFFFKARKSAVKSDLLIVNHHLLCADIDIRREIGDFSLNALLPAYSKLIIDEAHNLEDVATNYFGNIVTRIGLKRVLNKLYSSKRGKKTGILAFIDYVIDTLPNKNDAQQEILQLIDKKLKKSIKTSVEQTDKFFDTLFEYAKGLKKQNKEETKIRLKAETIEKGYDDVKEQGKILSEILLDIAKTLKSIVRKCNKLSSKEKEDIIDEIKELDSMVMKLSEAGITIEENLAMSKPDEKVYWIELKNFNDNKVIKLSSCPLNVGKFLNETIFGKFNNTVVLTSATLTSNNNFYFIKKRIGLEQNLEREILENILESPFNYETQMSICIPMDIVDPQSSKYLEISTEYVKRIIEVTQGSTFLLFTSFYAMDYAYRGLISHFGEKKLTLLKQGMYNRHTILTRFRNSDNAVLLGTDSFWEGVDVSGDALRCVVLMKLPFRVPTEPIIQARIEKMEREKINSFMEYTVPQTVIKFRQGFGRLIRSKTDKGCVVCLDKRIATMFYGKIFLDSLPPANRVVGYSEDILSEIRKYFR